VCSCNNCMQFQLTVSWARTASELQFVGQSESNPTCIAVCTFVERNSPNSLSGRNTSHAIVVDKNKYASYTLCLVTQVLRFSKISHLLTARVCVVRFGRSNANKICT
jgi:hypothetical protein